MAKKKKWNGMCPANKHGLDYEGQTCDLCKPPVPTRAEVEEWFKQYLSHEAERYDKMCEEWRTKFAEYTLPVNVLHDLDWGMGFLEVSAKWGIYKEIVETWTYPGTMATFESLYAYAVDKAIDKARFPSRSSSPMSNLMQECIGMAWATVANDFKNWGHSIKKADETYGTQAKT